MFLSPQVSVMQFAPEDNASLGQGRLETVCGISVNILGARSQILAVIWCMFTCASALSGDRPNIFFLFADDQRSGTLNLGGTGNPDIVTPTLDSLADSGAYFPNTYVFGADRGSVCTPSRAQLLSGKCLFKTDEIDKPSSGPEDFNLPVALRLNGYVTMRSGKANNVPYGINSEFDVNRERANRGGVGGNLGYWQDAFDFVNGKPITGLHGSKAEWDGVQPFFIYLAVGTPHAPYPADEEAAARYVDSRIDLPEDVLVPHGVLSELLNKKFRSRDDATPQSVREELTRYYASVTFMDRQLGAFVSLLKAKGLYDNTIIVVAGDNGLSIGGHSLEGKSNLFEYGGMHVPLLIHGPNIMSGKHDALASLLDIFPTLCDLTDSPKPPTLDGLSLMPILSGTKEKVRDHLLTVYSEPGMEQRAVRDSRWKLWYFPGEDIYELYDLDSDPRELVNLVNHEEHYSHVAEMIQLMAAERRRFGDCYPQHARMKQPFKKRKPAPHMTVVPFEVDLD
ncbi:MAG: sulfatase-like hydrolase/transferase [Planctomycetota bacterium]